MNEFFKLLSEFFSKLLSGILKVLHLSRFANHPEFKPTLNTIFLTFSCLLIIVSYTRGIKDILTKIGAIIVLATLDIAMQWILGLAKAYWKAKYITLHKTKCIVLIIMWLWYITVFAIPTGVGFFKHNLSVQKTQITSIINSHTRYNDIYEQNKKTIENLQAQLELESKSIHGKRSETLTSKIAKLEEKQTELNEKLNKNEKENEKVSQVTDQSFKEISDVLITINSKFTDEFLMLLACFSAVAMIYLFLALTAWDVPIENKAVQENKLDDFKKKLLIFLDALFEGRNKSGLKKDIPVNGIRTTSELTKMSEDECIGYRDHLATLKVNGGYAITVTQGGTTANHSKEFIRNFIINH